MFLTFALSALLLSATALDASAEPAKEQVLTSEKKSKIPLFIPPKGWECALPKNLSPHVHVGFIGKGSSQFHPSINLATEEVDIPLKEYVKAVKEIHLAEKNTTWRDLGKFSMRGGVGRLTEISSSSPWGEVKMLQAILVEENVAYILTSAALKKEYQTLQKEILQSLQSLTLAPDLFSVISDEDKKREIESDFARLGNFLPTDDIEKKQKEQWESLQARVIDRFPEMGSHWHFLALRQGYAKIYPSAPSRQSP
jgi:hypothetical protein